MGGFVRVAAVAGLFLLGNAGTSITAAQGTCAAKSCSQARLGCMKRSTHGIANRTRDEYCDSQYESCMQTGVFIGKFCGRKAGLAKR